MNLADEFAALYDVDIISNIHEVLLNPDYVNSDIAFDYYLGLNQKITVTAKKTTDASGEIYRFDIPSYDATSSFFYFDVANISRKRIQVYVNNQLIVTSTSKYIAIRLASNGVTFSVT